jgi:hypothetical protein
MTIPGSHSRCMAMTYGILVNTCQCDWSRETMLWIHERTLQSPRVNRSHDMALTTVDCSPFLDPAAPSLASVLEALEMAEPDPRRRGRAGRQSRRTSPSLRP